MRIKLLTLFIKLVLIYGAIQFVFDVSKTLKYYQYINSQTTNTKP